MELVMKILVAEDEPNTRTLLSGALRKWGYDVVSVADGEAAWHELERGAIRLVVCDWEMPFLEGPDLCLRVRTQLRGPYIYFVLLTHHADSASIARGLDSGADDFLSKPFNPVELRARLEVGKRLLGLHDELLSKNEQLDALNEKLRYLAATDSLTQLGNRRSLDETMGPLHTLAAARGQTYGVLLLDIDHFKVINDRYGHPAGDRVLARTADALRGATREGDLVFRYGGEEYVVVALGTTVETLTGLAERLRVAVASTPMDTGTPHGAVNVTASLGCALYDGRESVEWPALVARADAALYIAKGAGRDRIVIAGGSGT
jgi:diguanylate cyclase (GGDEF)-like protein